MSGAASPLKFALVSHVIPPACAGQSVVLARLLGEVRPTDYCLVSRQLATGSADSPDALLPLPARTVSLPQPPTGSARRLLGAAWAHHLLRRARVIMRAAGAHGSRAIVACSGDIYDVPAAALASRWLGLPFYAYLLDDYVYQWVERSKRLFARAAERLALGGAAGLIVPNEFLADVYRRRHGVEPTIVRNPYDPAHDLREADEPASTPGGGLRVVFTGTVYHAHFDALRRLAEALREVPGGQLHIYTPQDPALLRREGVVGPVSVWPQVSPLEVSAIQRAADVLFLPLGFSRDIPEVLRTAAPGKLGEYLRVGRAVLAHAPADSFVAHWFRTRRCGLLVDRPDVSALSAALRRLREEPDLVAALRANARAAAAEFSPAEARRALFDLLARGGAAAGG